MTEPNQLLLSQAAALQEIQGLLGPALPALSVQGYISLEDVDRLLSHLEGATTVLEFIARPEVQELIKGKRS